MSSTLKNFSQITATTIKNLFLPLLLSADLCAAYWHATRKQAFRWAIAALLADWVARGGAWVLSGPLRWPTLEEGAYLVIPFILTLATPAVLMLFTPRLAKALAHVYVTQALGSLILLASLLEAQALGALTLSFGQRESILFGWQVWCLFCGAMLTLRYLRSPKSSFKI